jgi:transcriptional regulator with XRE-family HTH domain
MSTSEKPFGAALRALMDARRLTYRGLAQATRALDGRGLTHAHINMLANGHDKPSMRAMELIAQACDVNPAYFAEYRLAVATRELDPEVVGLARALENLSPRLAARRTPVPEHDQRGHGGHGLVPRGSDPVVRA